MKIGPFKILVESVANHFSSFNSDISGEDSSIAIVLHADETLPLRSVVSLSNREYQFSSRSVTTALQKSLATEGVKHRVSLVVHAAGLYKDNSGFLIYGVSGAGKSTLTRKLHSYFLSGNDDNNLVMFPTNGASTFSFTSLPFYNREKQPPTPMKRPASVRAAFLLEKEFDDASSVSKIEDKDSVWRFLIDGQVQAPMLEPELFPKYNDMISEFVDKTDFFLLKHNLNDSPEFLFNLISQVCND